MLGRRTLSSAPRLFAGVGTILTGACVFCRAASPWSDAWPETFPMGELTAYVGMFWTAFLAATILPGASEALLVGLLLSGTGEAWAVLAAATVGNTLGSIANWICGRFLGHYRDRRWFPVPPLQLDRFSGLFQRYGMVSLLFAWAPIVGDALTVITGTLRIPLLPFTVVVGVGKLARYLVVAAGACAWDQGACLSQ